MITWIIYTEDQIQMDSLFKRESLSAESFFRLLGFGVIEKQHSAWIE